MDRPSRQTAWDYWKLVMLLLFVIFSSIVLYEAISKNHVKKDLTNKELILVFQNGYLRGILNAQYQLQGKNMQEIWQTDSLNFVKKYSK